MLSIWIGRAGSGKSEKVLRTIASERTQRAQVLIVPEHTSHRAEVDLCRACGETASRNAEVLSFQNLATRVLSRTGGLADVTLDGGGKLLTMRLALQELSGQLKVFHHPSQRAAFLQQLVELAEEFYAYEIRPEELYEKTQEIGGAMGDKLQSSFLARMTRSSTRAGATRARGWRSCATRWDPRSTSRGRTCTSTDTRILTDWRRIFSPSSCVRRIR